MRIICEKARMAKKNSSMSAKCEVIDHETGENLETILLRIALLSGRWKDAYNRERKNGNLKGYGNWK